MPAGGHFPGHVSLWLGKFSPAPPPPLEQLRDAKGRLEEIRFFEFVRCVALRAPPRRSPPGWAQWRRRSVGREEYFGEPTIVVTACNTHLHMFCGVIFLWP